MEGDTCGKISDIECHLASFRHVTKSQNFDRLHNTFDLASIEINREFEGECSGIFLVSGAISRRSDGPAKFESVSSAFFPLGFDFFAFLSFHLLRIVDRRIRKENRLEMDRKARDNRTVCRRSR
jgi:hypothetical protein